MNQHPSFLELDQLALGKPGTAELVTHLSTCAHCAAYLATLREPLPLPSGLERAVAPQRRRPTGVRRWLPPLAALAAACLILLAHRHRFPPAPPQPPIEKGAPQVSVYLKRGERVMRWQAGQSVRPGDLIRIEVRPAGKRYISVATDDASGGLSHVLYASEVHPHEVVALPVSWQIDAVGDRERLDVLLGDDPIAADAHRAPRATVYHQLITLPKQGGDTR